MLGRRNYNDVMLDTWQGDITDFAVDVLVTAANAELAGGGGVDAAVHSAAGPNLLAACQDLGGCPPGSAVITDGYNLPCQKVIHAVGPVYRGGENGEADLLHSAYKVSLDLFQKSGCRHISFPAISAGVYGYPKEDAAQVSWRAIKSWVESESEAAGKRITLVLYDSETYAIYTEALQSVFTD
jgi:O-acetyl-ADP-ribose deacetylase (regulator of RNase III)